MLSNSKATFNLENVNLLRNPNVNPKNGVAYKKTCSALDRSDDRSIYKLQIIFFEIYSVQVTFIHRSYITYDIKEIIWRNSLINALFHQQNNFFFVFSNDMILLFHNIWKRWFGRSVLLWMKLERRVLIKLLKLLDY